jgi:hypothetical protein
MSYGSSAADMSWMNPDVTDVRTPPACLAARLLSPCPVERRS